MIHKGSKLYSVVHGVCPRCQEGKVFKYAPYKNLDFVRMNGHCPVCNLEFEPEPDFYQGAMYVSYGLSTGLFLLSHLLGHWAGRRRVVARLFPGVPPGLAQPVHPLPALQPVRVLPFLPFGGLTAQFKF
jgi:hypothetical protein